jgi:hypothetical protein
LARDRDRAPALSAPAPAPSEHDSETVVVTGSRIPSAPHSITNNQTVGVDEGDIVKQVGRFLLVLQDGRLFSVDTRPHGAPGLRFLDRANVYRGGDEDTWYDEMLTFGRRIVVTGYSYGKSATEFTVLNIGASGRLTREETYYISSNDYYDIENYASRIIGDKLVIYSPLDLSAIDPDSPLDWPLVRRWTSTNENHLSQGVPLYDARSVYRPIQASENPVLHTITVCPLGLTRRGDELNCRATGFVAPDYHQFYVDPRAVYLWTAETGADDDWETPSPAGACGHDDEFAHGPDATLYRLPISGEAPRAMRVRGAPFDQFGLHTSDREFHALLFWNDVHCHDEHQANAVRFFSAPLSDFHTSVTNESASHYTSMPSPGGDAVTERFTESFVVYADRHPYMSYPPFEASDLANAIVVAAPIANPSHTIVMRTPHNVIRVERAGDNIALTGYHDQSGLYLSLVDLSRRPRIASTVLMPHRYESEGRSHAFNSDIDEHGKGLLGVPTIERRERAGRWWWRSEASDVSFLAVNDHGRVRSIGPLKADPHALRTTYHCEVSCIDWYGNTRPIFTDGRLFALSGVELIEGVIRNGLIRERRRLNLSGPPPQR